MWRTRLRAQTSQASDSMKRAVSLAAADYALRSTNLDALPLLEIVAILRAGVLPEERLRREAKAVVKQLDNAYLTLFEEYGSDRGPEAPYLKSFHKFLAGNAILASGDADAWTAVLRILVSCRS